MKPRVAMREALTDPALLGSVLGGDTWLAWRALLIAMMGEKLSKRERSAFQKLTGRAREPLQRVEEFWGVIGRRGGKTRAAAVLAVYLAALCDHSDSLSAGERGLCLFLAVDQKQAGVAFHYAAGIFDAVPLLAELVVSRTADTIALRTGIDLEVRPASFRGLRGLTAVAAVADELAFWRVGDDSANADTDILTALRPALSTTGGLLAAISTPYAKRGELYATWRQHYGGQGDPRIMVAVGASR